MIIIGIDCATDPRKMGLARASYNNGQCSIIDALQGASGEKNVQLVASWVREEPDALLALDAPLGWPVALGDELVGHHAGELLDGESNNLFRRETDRTIYRYLKKQPLDVGADRIARTAHSALRFLAALRRLSNYSLPLAWSHDALVFPSVIEVYPAATLLAHQLRSNGYKKSENSNQREEIIVGLSEKVTLPESVVSMRENADALDAAVCILAGADFLNGAARNPEDHELAIREGWIWVKA